MTKNELKKKEGIFKNLKAFKINMKSSLKTVYIDKIKLLINIASITIKKTIP